MPTSTIFYSTTLLLFVFLFSFVNNAFGAIQPPPFLPRPASDRSMVYLHSTTINTLKEKDILATLPDIEQIQYLVHVSEVNAVVTREITAQIESWHGKVLSYIPRDTFLITCDLHCAADLYSFPGVTWVGPFTPSMKISPSFKRKARKSLPAQATNSINLRVTTVTSPLTARRRDNTGTAGIAQRWLSEIYDILDTKFARRIQDGGKRFVDMVPLHGNQIHVTIHHTEDAVVDEVVKWISERPEAHWVEPKLNPAPNNKYSRPNIQSGTTDTAQAWAWENGLKGSGEVVGIADSGLNGKHCFFYDPNNPTITINSTNFNHRKVIAYYALGDSTDEYDGHGTHTSGSIAGFPSNSSSPLTAYSGQAPEAKLVFVDVKQGAKLADTFTIPDNFEYLYGLTYNATARIHSDSWGTADYPYYSNSAFQLDDFHFNHLDFLNVRSVGNDGDNGYSTMNAECAAKNVLCVGSSSSSKEAFLSMEDWTDYNYIIKEINYGLCEANRVAQNYNLTCLADNSTELNLSLCCSIATFNYDCCIPFLKNLTAEQQAHFKIDNIVTFSSRGPTVDSRTKPDVIGPGAFIYSSRSLMTEGDNYCNAEPWTTNPSQSAINVLSGTSQTTALLAGVTSLVRQYYREGYWKNGAKDLSHGFSPSGALMKATMINSAVYLNDTLFDIQTFKPSFNVTDDYTFSTESTYSEGYGRVQLNNVLWFGDSHMNLFMSSNSTRDNNITTGDYHEYCFKANNAKTFKATLVWTDPPASTASFFSLVNDLDLMVADDSGLLYGNGLYGGDGYPAPDQVNNVEQVTMKTTNGTVKVYVYGYAVVTAAQPYALVVTGGFEIVTCPECTYNKSDITSQACTIPHGYGVQYCTPSGFFSKCHVKVCDSGYVTGSLIDSDGCAAIISLTIYSGVIMAGIAAISVLMFLVLCSKIGKRNQQKLQEVKSYDDSTNNAPDFWTKVMMISKLAQPESALIMEGTVCSVIVVGLNLVVPLISADIFDVLYNTTDSTASLKRSINQSIAILGACTAGMIIFEFVQGTILSLAGHRLITRLRIELFQNILLQEMAFFDQRSTGELMSRLATDVAFLRGILSHSLPTIVSQIAQLSGGLVMMFIISWQLTLVVVAPIPLLAISFKYYGAYINAISVRAQDTLADAATVATEALFNIRTVRWLNGEAKELKRFNAFIMCGFYIARRLVFMTGFYGVATGISAHVFTLVLMTYGAYLVLDGKLTPALLIAFNLFVPFVNDAVYKLSDLYTEFQGSMGASKRFFELIERQSRIPGSTGNKITKVKGHLAVQNLCFAYPARPDVQVLNNLTLDFNPGTITALVGPSGSGKTTVLGLIGRLYDPISGSVFLDGHDVKTLDVNALRDHIGIVNQEPSLFSGTIAENVAYANESATRAQVVDACKKANAHDFIMQFPQEYDTPLGDRGAQLSGGQKQRIAIARAILKNPSILLLDEATSELDVESEHLVQQALESLMAGKTVIIVAHRLSTVLSADVIAVVDDGQVAEKGTHEELLEKRGIYFEFVQRQWKKGGHDLEQEQQQQQQANISEQEQLIINRRTKRVQTLIYSQPPTNISYSADTSQPQSVWKRIEVKKKDTPSAPEREKERSKLIMKSKKKIRQSVFLSAHK